MQVYRDLNKGIFLDYVLSLPDILFLPLGRTLVSQIEDAEKGKLDITAGIKLANSDVATQFEPFPSREVSLEQQSLILALMPSRRRELKKPGIILLSWDNGKIIIRKKGVDRNYF